MSGVSPVAIRADLASLPDYVAGRTISGAIKLASNELPDGPLPSVTEAIIEAAEKVNRYPDPGASGLTGRLAAKFDMPTERIAVGCGSVSVCQHLVQALCQPGDEVIFAWRSFEAYPIITQISGAQPVRVPLTEDHRHDLPAMLAAITPRTKLIFLCSPNNPTGTALRRAELADFLDQVPEHVVVAIDEAYREFVTDDEVPDGLEFVRERANVVVVRTFSKAYGLAGLRVGYGVASPAIASAIRKVYTPFSVNHVAQAAAIAALDADDQVRARCAEIVDERTRVHKALLASGYQVPETEANFVWLPLAERTEEFAAHSLEHKIVVRPFAGEGVRVTIGKPEENNLFLDAARAFAAAQSLISFSPEGERLRRGRPR